jgi:hypothetical protein
LTVLQTVALHGDNVNVVAIREQAFRDATYIAEIRFPPGLRRINWEAFYGCRSLTNVTFDGNPSLSAIGDRVPSWTAPSAKSQSQRQ